MSDVTVSQKNPFEGLPRFDARQVKRHAAKLLEYHGMVNGDARKDAVFTAMFARELEYIYTETFDVIFASLKARKLIPVDNRVPSGKEFFTYRQFTQSGKEAEIVHNYADDAPTGDVYGEEFPQRIVSLTSNYAFSIQDMRAAAETGTPLEAKKAEVARLMIERKIESMAAFGAPQILQPDGATQMYGLFNAPNVNGTTQVSTGTWQAQYNADSSSNKTTSIGAMVSDLTALRQKVFNQTKGEAGDVGTLDLIFPTSLYSFLTSTPRSIQFDGTGQTLFEYLVKTTGFKGADFWNRADLAASGGSAGRIMAYEKNPRVVSLIISQEFEQFAPQPRNLGFVIPCHARTGAVEVRYPLHMSYMDGPSA